MKNIILTILAIQFCFMSNAQNRTQAFDSSSFFRTFSHHNIKANGINVHYVSGGKGEPIILLHGWPEDWYEWRKVMLLLQDKYTVYAVDLRGWGKTEKPANGYTLDTLAEDLNQFIIALNLQNVHLVGHDWGAPISAAFTALHEEKVKSLTLIEASLNGTGAGGEKLLNFSDKWTPLWFFPFLATPDLAEDMINGNEKIFYTWILKHMTPHPELVFTSEDIQHYIQTNTNPQLTKATCRYYKNILDSTHPKQLAKQLSIPVMVVGGEKSLGQWMIDAVKNSFAPQAKGVIIKDCGHVVPEEKPKELAQLIIDFTK